MIEARIEATLIFEMSVSSALSGALGGIRHLDVFDELGCLHFRRPGTRAVAGRPRASGRGTERRVPSLSLES